MTSPHSTAGAICADTAPPDSASASTGELSEQLDRNEGGLARAEVTQKARRLGLGAGLLDGGGLIAILGRGAVVLFAVAGVQADVDAVKKAVAR